MFYVYEWFRISDNFIFYVGKGTKNRYLVKNRNKKFNSFIAEYECDVRIIKNFDSEKEAFIFEEQKIMEYKKIGMCSCNMKYGGNGGVSGIWTDDMRNRMSSSNPMKDTKQRERMSINNPMKNPEIANVVGKKHKRPIVINGVVHEGTVDASKILGVSTNTILNWCKRGYDTNGNPCRYKDEKQKEFEFKRSNSIKVWVDDKLFNSVKDASEYIGVWSDSIIRAIKNNKPCKGYLCRYDNQHPSQVKSNNSNLEGSETNE